MAITLTTLPSQPATFFKPQALKSSTISPPKVSPTAPTESSLLLTLLIYRFGIFRDRWALFLRRSPTDPTGILLHMRDDGDGQFRFEIKRNYDTRMAAAPHPAMIDLAWVGKENFGDDNEENMWKKGVYFVERPGVPTCRFEEVIARAGGEGFMGSVYAQVQKEGYWLRPANASCQLWVIEAVQRLVVEGMVGEEVLGFLRARRQQ